MSCKKCKHTRGFHDQNGCNGKYQLAGNEFLRCTCKSYVADPDAAIFEQVQAIKPVESAPLGAVIATGSGKTIIK